MEELQKAMETKFADLKKQVEVKTSGVTLEVFTELETKYDKLVKNLAEAKSSDETKTTMDAMQKHLDILDGKMKLKKGAGVNYKSFNDSLKHELEGKSEEFASLGRSSSASINFEMKAAAMTFVNNSWDGTRALTDLDTSIGRAGVCPPRFRNIVNVGTTTGNRIVYIDKTTVDGGAGMTAEGAMKEQVEYKYTETAAEVKKITAFVKVSKEMLDDVSFLRSEINADLRNEIEMKLDEQIANGDGLTVNMRGVNTIAPTLTIADGPYFGTVDVASPADVIRVAIATISGNCFNANYVIVNPADAALMDLSKGSDGHYVMPPFASADGATIAGVRIITSTEIEVGSFLAGDFTKYNLRIREDININVGYENDDFTRNMVTILAEMRAVGYVKSQHEGAFLKGSFEDVITAIDNPVG